MASKKKLLSLGLGLVAAAAMSTASAASPAPPPALPLVGSLTALLSNNPLLGGTAGAPPSGLPSLTTTVAGVTTTLIGILDGLPIKVTTVSLMGALSGPGSALSGILLNSSSTRVLLTQVGEFTPVLGELTGLFSKSVGVLTLSGMAPLPGLPALPNSSSTSGTM